MAVSRITDSSKLEFNKNLGADKTFRLYEQMSELVQKSAKTNIQEEFEFVIFNDTVSSYQEIFHKNFSNVYDVWKQGCNVLFLDCDTFVKSPVSIFGKYNEFRLFNYTDPKQLMGKDKNNKYKLDFHHYFNAGVRYYPANMDQHVWDLGWSYASNWDYGIWGTEQLIFNAMMYSQNPDVNYWHQPEMNYQAMRVSIDDIKQGSGSKRIQQLNNWNGCKFEDAKIVHLHGTRGADNVVKLQEVLMI